MKILAIGDIFGKIGRQVIKEYLPKLKAEQKIDLVIANVENTTHGKGISKKHYQELKNSGIEVMTSGNHIFACEETQKFIQEVSDLLRPLNSNPYHPGQGTFLTERNGKKIRVTNLIGRTFMPMSSENPYFALKKIIDLQDCDIHLVDFHAEATAEKLAFAWYFVGEITVLWGTHTHVQTADERILANQTAFITDLGMTGPSEGIIGAERKAIIRRAKEGLPAKIVPHEDLQDKGQFNGVIFEINENNKVIKIQRINKTF